MSHHHNPAEPATDRFPAQQLPAFDDGYDDEPAFPMACVVSHAVAVLLFGGIGVIVVLAQQAVLPTLLGLLSFGIAGYLLSIPINAVRNWYDEVYGPADQLDDELDDGTLVVELADDGLGLFDHPGDHGGQP